MGNPSQVYLFGDPAPEATPERVRRAARTIEARKPTLAEHLEERPVAARGKTVSKKDMSRLNAQAQRVYNVLRDLRPHTLAEISSATGDPQASVSARWREIRAYLRIGDKGDGIRKSVPGKPGLFTYEIRLNKHSGAA